MKNYFFKFKFNNREIFLLILFFLLFLYRLHNNWYFNPYWGYDGGEHINYLFSLIKDNQIPSILKNTIAWHEPLYYLILWPIGKFIYFFTNNELVLLKSFGVFQAILSVSTTYIIYRIINLLNQSYWLTLTITAFLTFLPPFNQASTFLTNELLNYFFILLIILYFLNNFILKKTETRKKDYLILAVICGLALLTKITALIVILSILIFFIFNLYSEKKLQFKSLLLFFVIIIAMNTPWFIYKHFYISPGFSINNQHFLEPKPLKLDNRINFFLKFDTDIFIFPYWYSGGRSFWSMLYADSFYDYYGTIENKNYINYLIKNKPSKLARTTHASTYVTQKNKNLTNIILYLSPFLALMIILGFIYLIFKFFKTKKSSFLFYLVVTAGFLLALIYSAYRYPYYDHGIVKSIFIFPFYIFPIWAFFEMIKKNQYILIFFQIIILIYLIIVINNYSIINFAY
jgi:4-amino-4-deoxy-L-arabinose transferase-like glycosyltransferase